MDFSEMQVRAHRDASRAAELGLTAQDVKAMPPDAFNRTFGYDRPTPTEAALAAVRADSTAADSPAPAAPRIAPQPPESAPQGVSVADMTMEQYAVFRREAGIGRGEYGVGLLNQAGSWADAARAKAGRSAMAGNRNTVEPPRLGGRYLNHDAGIDHRSAAARFSTPGNEFSI